MERRIDREKLDQNMASAFVVFTGGTNTCHRLQSKPCWFIVVDSDGN